MVSFSSSLCVCYVCYFKADYFASNNQCSSLSPSEKLILPPQKSLGACSSLSEGKNLWYFLHLFGSCVFFLVHIGGQRIDTCRTCFSSCIRWKQKVKLRLSGLLGKCLLTGPSHWPNTEIVNKIFIFKNVGICLTLYASRVYRCPWMPQFLNN